MQRDCQMDTAIMVPNSRDADRNAGWPQPGAEACAHSQRLVEHIRKQMQSAGGALPFSQFMELALYAPRLGYYTAGAQKFGAEGDFVTAPEVSDLFGRCLARQCVPVMAAVGDSVLEIGAGSGALALSVLNELRRLDRLPQQYLIVEPSPDLQQRQRRALASDEELLARVAWLSRWPERFRGVVLANEVLDAMPCERFRVTRAGFEQSCVAEAADGFQWSWRPAPSSLRAALEHVQEQLSESLPVGYTSELSLWLAPWFNALAQSLDAGLVLLIDYGYPRRERYHPQRDSGTLMCHYRHRAHTDPLILAGLQDITAFVDFSAVAEAADEAGLEVAGYTSQAQFLIGAGLTELLAQSDPSDLRAHLELTGQAKLLTLPGEMGERFKVMGLTRELHMPLAGFSGTDLRGRL